MSLKQEEKGIEKQIENVQQGCSKEDCLMERSYRASTRPIQLSFNFFLSQTCKKETRAETTIKRLKEKLHFCLSGETFVIFSRNFKCNNFASEKKTEEEKENANLLSFQNLNAFFNVLKSYHPRISKLKLKLKL